jgi:hypothetical protein
MSEKSSDHLTPIAGLTSLFRDREPLLDPEKAASDRIASWLEISTGSVAGEDRIGNHEGEMNFSRSFC